MMKSRITVFCVKDIQVPVTKTPLVDSRTRIFRVEYIQVPVNGMIASETANKDFQSR